MPNYLNNNEGIYRILGISFIMMFTTEDDKMSTTSCRLGRATARDGH